MTESECYRIAVTLSNHITAPAPVRIWSNDENALALASYLRQTQIECYAGTYNGYKCRTAIILGDSEALPYNVKTLHAEMIHGGLVMCELSDAERDNVDRILCANGFEYIRATKDGFYFYGRD